MHTTKRPAARSSQAAPGDRPASRRSPRLVGAARLAHYLAVTKQNAETLVEDGYRFEIDLSCPGRLHVVKPTGQRAYTLHFSWDEMECRWRYTCDCYLYQSFVAARQKDAAVECECKHGIRGLSVVVAAMRMADHIRGVKPGALPAAAPAQAAPPATNGIVWGDDDRNGDRGTDRDRRGGDDPRNPWPTRRGRPTPPPPPPPRPSTAPAPAPSRGFASQRDFERARDADFGN